MRPRGWMLQTALFMALAPANLQAQPAQTQWNLGTFTWVKRVPAEPGAPPNTHPAQVSPESLRALLGSVQVKLGRKDAYLFGRADLKEVVPALSEALALAQPGEDLILLSTSRHGDGLLDPTEALTARLFVQGDALNLLVHDARFEFLIAYQTMNVQPTFVYGSRKAAAKEDLQAPLARRLRPDWLAFPLKVATAAIPPALPAPVLVPVSSSTPAPAQAQATPAAAPEPPPTAAQTSAYEAKAERLRTLKRLREENLISEAEYREKREAILKTL